MALVVEMPYPGARFQSPSACRGGYPRELALYGDAVDHVVRESAVDLVERRDRIASGQ
jgi:hypothetical protein